MVKVLQVSLLFFVGILAVHGQCPRIIPRSGWAPRESGRLVPVLPIRPAPLVVVHPTGTASCTNQADCSAIIRDIQAFQIDANGWADISYHFLVGGDNNIYQGRGWGRMGENIGQFTNQAINIGYIGTFTDELPAENIAAHLDSLINCGVSARALDTTANVVAQCQVTNMVACDATTIFQWVSEHPRFIETPRPV
ncbi:CLUMA_CG019133, isoform A [Clunio marinus]|uniref:CLUMA_CG019133, isoform A n=1 Tax=Clunio marinus TaxID=568069 RepID=A0A1J1J264_9DIPT|nr:CLUMA_CG019133, isoform A [Clunio marinus]